MREYVARHLPVLLNETIDFLALQENGTYLDCTFGGGGHTRAILESHSGISVVAIDVDPEAAIRAEELLKAFPDRFSFYRLNFSEIDKLPEMHFSGILFDLGVSSFQLDDPKRGFSFRFEGSNDMRLNPESGQSAHEFLETASEKELMVAVRDFGEERFWKSIVKAIIQARGTEALGNTKAFADLVKEAIPVRFQKTSSIHPATKTFQGIRMAINEELKCIEEGLLHAFERLEINGRLVVISFHSLEDRIVKRFFRRMAGEPEHARDSIPKDLRKSYAKILTRQPVLPKEEEINTNPRSRSSKLRALLKTTSIK